MSMLNLKEQNFLNKKKWAGRRHGTPAWSQALLQAKLWLWVTQALSPTGVESLVGDSIPGPQRKALILLGHHGSRRSTATIARTALLLAPPPRSLLPQPAPRGKEERTSPCPCPAAAILDRAERALLQSSAQNSHKNPKPYLPPKPISKRMPHSTQTKTEAGNGVPVGVSGKCSLGYNLVA